MTGTHCLPPHSLVTQRKITRDAKESDKKTSQITIGHSAPFKLSKDIGELQLLQGGYDDILTGSSSCSCKLEVGYLFVL